MKSDPSKPALRAWSDDIDALLGAQLGRIRRRFLVHGAAWMGAALAGVTCAYFLLDVGLELPVGARLLLSAGLLVYLGAGLRRRVLYPLRRSFGSQDVAIAIERVFPDLRESLITAVQLKGALAPDAPQTDLRNQSSAMVERVVADAASQARALPLDRLLTNRRTSRVLAAAAGACLALTIAAGSDLSRFGVFLQRALGVDAAYPRRTHLAIELPDEEGSLRIERTESQVTVTMATGADLPVLVRADGVVPREVFLVVQGGRGLPGELTMSQRPGERFRYVFRRVQGEFSFHARGGDDPHGDVEVRVRTVDPPLVGTIEADLQFPAYTGLETAHRSGGAIEALVGTEVDVVVTATNPAQRAALHFLDADVTLDLVPERIVDDSGASLTFRGRFSVQTTDRYEVQLENAEGLRNPRPGAYPVIALDDHPPVGRVLLPSGDDVNVVLPDALLPVRVETTDDFGLSSIVADASSGARDGAATVGLFTPPAGTVVRAAIVTALLPVRSFADGDGPRQGDTLNLVVRLVDNREPTHATTELNRRQVHVVDAIELARRIATQFRRIRDQVEKSLDQQRAQRDALDALLEDLPDPSIGRDPRVVTLQVGATRIVGGLRRARDELMRAYDTHLFNGLEGAESTQPPRVRELYLAFLQQDQTAEPWVPALYRAIAEEQRAGRIGAMEKALDPILAMVLRTDELVEDFGGRTSSALDEASVTASTEALRNGLRTARELQDRMVASLEELLGQLQEWNEFQDVVQQARELRDAQRDIEYRTRTTREPNEEKR